MNDITRAEDDNGKRFYTDGDVRYYSVTEVLNELEEDTSGLDYWKRQNDGEGDNAFWQHLFWVSGPRGTLTHYECLDPLTDEDLWGAEESKADTQIRQGPVDGDTIEEWNDNDVPLDTREIAYSLCERKGSVSSREQFDTFLTDVTLEDLVQVDIDWAANTFHDEVRPFLGISDDPIAVEQYLLHHDPGYGGQCDLLYENHDGETVLADLKTSSGLRQKYPLQAVAYAQAVEDNIGVEVDRLEVVRLYPDERTWMVHSHDYPDSVSEDHEHYTTEHWFDDKYGNWEYEDLDEMLTTFESLVEDAQEKHDDSSS